MRQVALLVLFLFSGQVVDLSAEMNWGTLKHDGNSVTIFGHERWIAVGRIRDDGRVYLQWVENSTGRTAHSVYKIDGKKLIGNWGWSDQCEVLENGELFGQIHSDTTYPVSR